MIFAGLITLTENVQKSFQCNFCDQWRISFILKSFYQIPLTWSKTYHRGKVLAEKSSGPEGIKEILFEEEEKMLKSDIASKTQLNREMLIRDPYESTLVDVRKSTVKGAGQGVFLTSK